MADKIIVIYDKSMHGISIGRYKEGKTKAETLKVNFGEQADTIYRILTEQDIRASIKEGE